MFKYDKKLLVSGCGLTFSGQQAKTWVNILSLAGADITDVGGPAVSNQWIINRAFLQLEADTDIRQAVIQLTSIGKLDVEVNDERIETLVEPDTIRNFTVDNVWPSSASIEHPSKQLWKQWLFSPKLEQQDVICKLRLLKHWCNTHDVKLTVIQGYKMFWDKDQQAQLASVIDNIEYNIMDHYQGTEWYNSHGNIDVPVIGFQFEIARVVAQQVDVGLVDRVEKICQDFVKSRR
jgi:hypothetical protein